MSPPSHQCTTHRPRQDYLLAGLFSCSRLRLCAGFQLITQAVHKLQAQSSSLRTAQSRDAGVYPECLRGEVIRACPPGRRPQGRPEPHRSDYSSRLPLAAGRTRAGGFAWVAACDPCPGILQKVNNDCCVSAGFGLFFQWTGADSLSLSSETYLFACLVDFFNNCSRYSRYCRLSDSGSEGQPLLWWWSVNDWYCSSVSSS